MYWLRFCTFVKSLFFHIYSGSPKATKEEIFVRWSICVGCDKFDKNKSECSVCGCNLDTESKFLNKLAWADQECPEKKWLPIIRK